MAGILDGVRVLDFGRYVATPYCAAILADLGAEVIRIEKPGGGEDRFITPLAEDGSGPCYLQSNRGKRGMTLNPLKPEGREIAHKLIATADVVMVNQPPAAIDAMGLDYHAVSAIKPDIILTTVTAFGEIGPYRDRVGFDGIAQAMSGSTYLSGSPQQPQRSIAPYVDYGTALASAVGTMAALMERARSGRGQQVSADLLGTALNFFNMQLMEQAVAGVNRAPTGNRSPAAAPVDVFKCKDGWLMASVVGDALWQRWTEMVGEEGWRNDPRFANDIRRGEHGDILCARMAQWCAGKSLREAIDACEARRIPCGPVLTPQQALDDPHVQAAGYMKGLDYPGIAGATPLAATPFRMSVTEAGIKGRAPLLGEHTDAILAELGYGAAVIENLRARRVI
ncbi:MAG: CaiB/BaiF CoA transferase family protein [Burkholderiales bacterium]